MKEPIPELKLFCSADEFIDRVNELIRRENERNETPRITKCVSTGYGLCPCPCHTGKSHTADRIYWCVCRDKPQCPGCGVYRGFDHADNCGDSQAVPAPDTNERNEEKPTHTDRRGRHDKMMCWGDKSCPGCECMCHRPEDSTKAEHDTDCECRANTQSIACSMECPSCSCHKKPEHTVDCENGCNKNCECQCHQPSKQDTVQEEVLERARIAEVVGEAVGFLRGLNVGSDKGFHRQEIIEKLQSLID